MDYSPKRVGRLLHNYLVGMLLIPDLPFLFFHRKPEQHLRSLLGSQIPAYQNQGRAATTTANKQREKASLLTCLTRGSFIKNLA